MAYFEMDALINGVRPVQASLEENAQEFIQRTYHDVLGSAEGRFIINASELLLPDERDSRAVTLSDAFCEGASVAIASFMLSDLPAGEIQRTLRMFSGRVLPGDLTRSDAAHRFKKFAARSTVGLRTHAELRTHLQLIMGYAIVSRRSDTAGMFAATGFGFAIDRIDTCWDSVRERDLRQGYGLADEEKIDWDGWAASLLEDQG